jgi:aryl-alcohol dehydrogenase-like predicted oxidoreductase
MKYRQLGDSSLMVSEIAFGSWLTTAGGVEKTQAIACVRRALDCGITLIDTANIYGKGIAEAVLGEALADVKRDSYVLATKLFFPMTETDRGLSRAQILKQIDASLTRLKVDYVDLYQCHRYDHDTPLEETMAALSEIVRAGKARYIGFSEWPADKIAAALALPNVVKFVSSQPQYSLLHRDPEAAVIPRCARSGKYRPGAAVPVDSRAANASMNFAFRQAWLQPKILAAVQALKPLADQAGLSLSQFALAWVLREPNVASAIIGASRPEQVVENAAASGADVSASLFAEAERIIAAGLTG